jgi:hypothetical protein
MKRKQQQKILFYSAHNFGCDWISWVTKEVILPQRRVHPSIASKINNKRGSQDRKERKGR